MHVRTLQRIPRLTFCRRLGILTQILPRYLLPFPSWCIASLIKLLHNAYDDNKGRHDKSGLAVWISQDAGRDEYGAARSVRFHRRAAGLSVMTLPATRIDREPLHRRQTRACYRTPTGDSQRLGELEASSVYHNRPNRLNMFWTRSRSAPIFLCRSCQ